MNYAIFDFLAKIQEKGILWSARDSARVTSIRLPQNISPFPGFCSNEKETNGTKTVRQNVGGIRDF